MEIIITKNNFYDEFKQFIGCMIAYRLSKLVSWIGGGDEILNNKLMYGYIDIDYSSSYQENHSYNLSQLHSGSIDCTFRFDPDIIDDAELYIRHITEDERSKLKNMLINDKIHFSYMKNEKEKSLMYMNELIIIKNKDIETNMDCYKCSKMINNITTGIIYNRLYLERYQVLHCDNIVMEPGSISSSKYFHSECYVDKGKHIYGQRMKISNLN
jgi:hypothetical protein